VTEQDMETRIKAIQEMKRQKIAAGDIKAVLTEQEIDQVVPEKFRDQASKFQSSGSWTGAPTPKVADPAPKVAVPAPKVTAPAPDESRLTARERQFLDGARALEREGQTVTPRAVAERLGWTIRNPSGVACDIKIKGLWPWEPASRGRAPGSPRKDRRHAVRTAPGTDGSGLVPPPAPRADAAPLANGYAPDYQPGAWPEEPRREDRPAPGRHPERQPEAPASRFSLTDFVAKSDELDLEHTLNLANAIRECRPGLRCLLLAFAGELLIEEC
jgi:hypothetical protein